MSGDATPIPTPDPYVLTAEDMDALTSYDFPVHDGPGGRPCVFKMRRLELLTLLLENIVPSEIYQAALAAYAKAKEHIDEKRAETFADAFGLLSDDEKIVILEKLHRFACAAVLQPTLVRTPTGAPGEFPVTRLSVDLLMAMWNYTPPTASVPRLSGVAATEFCGAAGPGVDTPAPDRASVRPAAVDVDSQPATAEQS